VTYTKQKFLASLLPVSGFLLCFGMAAQAQSPLVLPVDEPMRVDGIEAACTGIGDGEQHEARWRQYPLKIETVGGYGQWLGDEDVTFKGKGRDVSVHCDGPWVLIDLPSGNYDATISVPDTSPRHLSVHVPSSGQREVIVRFRDASDGAEQSNHS
jgi:hypothetical protein